MKLLAMYLLLGPSEIFGQHTWYAASYTLPDIKSEMYALLFQKNRSIWFKAIKSAVHVYSEFCAFN